MKNQTEITMRDIPRETGVAVSTVSKALRDDPSLPVARCEEIKHAACRMGYPNPLVATLMARLHHHRRRDDPHTIAWIDFGSDEPAGFFTFNIGPSLQGARERAEALGYGIEVYHPVSEELSVNRLSRILKTRGHWGVIIPPVPDRFRTLALDTRGLATVTIGTSLQKPVMHRVSPNHFQAASLAFRKMRDKGFTRIGLILESAINTRVSGKWLGAYLSERMLLPVKERVTPLILPRSDPSHVANWLKCQRPDAVLVADPHHAQEWLRLGSRGRETIGWLMQADQKREYSGLDYHPERLGMLAVDLMIGQIHRNERGSPEMAHTTLIDAAWSEWI